MKSIWIAAAIGMIAALPALTALAADDDDPPEYRDRGEARDAYRRGYERGRLRLAAYNRVAPRAPDFATDEGVG